MTSVGGFMKRSRKQLVLALALLIASALAVLGCSSDELAHILGGGSVALGTPAFAIFSDFDGTVVHSYSVNATSGALTEVAGSPVATTLPGDFPWAVAVTPNGKFAYVGDQN